MASGPNMMNNRIDQTPMRISNNVTIARQTPKMDFGDRMKAGLDTAAGVVANGAAVVGGIVPGGAIISAAVSSVGAMTNNVTPSGGGGGGGMVGTHYGASGVQQLGGLNTTAGSGGAGSSVGAAGGSPNYVPNGGTTPIGDINNGLQQTQNENVQMIKLQMSMQRENMVFTSVSNVLKLRHDTAKNSIGNVR
jgi:hypothetical protein